MFPDFVFLAYTFFKVEFYQRVQIMAKSIFSSVYSLIESETKHYERDAVYVTFLTGIFSTQNFLVFFFIVWKNNDSI